MAFEIEKKFLVVSPAYREMAVSNHEIAQGYLSRGADATVRVRCKDGKGYLTVKSRNDGCVRREWEYEVPAHQAMEMLRIVGADLVEKRRWNVPFGGKLWEVDEFKGEFEGLVVAEVELDSADEVVELPPFVGQEVTGVDLYYNSNLSQATLSDARKRLGEG